MRTMNRFAASGIACALALLATNSAWAEAIERRTTAAFQLAAAGGAQQVVFEVNVPAGTWIITAKASVVSWGPADYVRCGLRANGAFLDGSTGMIGEAGGMPAVTTLYNQSLTSITGATRIALVCWHDFAIAGEFLDPGASLIISRVGEPPPLQSVSCVAPDPGTCWPGLDFVAQGAVPDAELPDGATQEDFSVDGTCVQSSSSTLVDPCQGEALAEIYFDTADPDGEQGHIVDTCPRSRQYKRCTSFGYCWCSANKRP
jgi:hypothetical protein